MGPELETNTTRPLKSQREELPTQALPRSNETCGHYGLRCHRSFLNSGKAFGLRDGEYLVLPSAQLQQESHQ
jgi:hypothetical protein